MLINEICKECNLTKKAVEYYEKQGLIKPKYNESNYRCFDNEDVTTLKEIAMLRKLDISIADIKTIITSEDRIKALTEYKIKKELQLHAMKTQYDCLNYLLDNNYNVEKTLETINHKLDENMIIKDKLIQEFPGTYGKYLSIHFGRFLNEKIDSNEKVLAYYKIVKFLDNISDADFPEELEQLLTEQLDGLTEEAIKNIDDSVYKSISDYNNYIDENKDLIERYLEYRNSEEFRSSPAYKMQQLLIKFQESSGYYNIFINNLKILSRSYSKYHEKLKLANKELDEKLIANIKREGVVIYEQIGE
jgi:DNA-binding transcriptional MerR regulator